MTQPCRIRLCHVLLFPFVVLPFFWFAQTGFAEDVVKVKEVEDDRVTKVKNALRAAKQEIEGLRKELSQVQQQVDKLENKEAPPLVYTPDPSDVGGTIKVHAAAVYCNCPALVSGDNATLVLQRHKLNAYKNRDIEGCTDVTAKFSEECNGKETCTLTLPAPVHVSGCPGKAVVDYQCGEKLVRAQSWQNPRENDTLSFTCTIPRKAYNVSEPRVGFVKAVPYEYQGKMIYVWPVGFTVPGHRYRGSISWKDKDFADLIPGNPGTYVHTQQGGQSGKSEPDAEYFRDYRRSLYCVTRKKMGWDCLRHYEILSQGCVPYFIDLARMPANTMVFFPKELVMEAMSLPGVTFKNERKGAFWFREAFSIDKTVFNESRYYELATQIQAHARQHLTSEAMAQYIIDAVAASGGLKTPKRILFIHHCYHDFMGDSLWNGFKELEVKGVLDFVADVVPPRELSTGGKNGYWGKLVDRGYCVHGRKVPLMTSEKTLNRNEYYGWVNGWGNHRSHNYFPAETALDPDTIPARIAKKEFDLVIYAQPSRTSAWLKEVSEAYPREQVAFLSGADSPENLHSIARFSENGIMFIREMYDDAGVTNTRSCFSAPGIADTQGMDCCAMSEGGAKVIWSSKFGDATKWKPCGNENDDCECSTEIRFGSSEQQLWSLLDLHDKKQVVKCMNSNAGGPFPDPAPGFGKVCQCRVM